MSAKELTFDRTGNASAGDENAPDFGELGLANLDIEVTPRDWREMDDVEAAESDEDEEAIEVDSDEDDSDEDDSDEEIEDDVQAGPAIISSYLENVGDAVEMLDRHVLVRGFGFPIDMLITPRGNPMGVEYLAVVTAACRAADELANLIDDREVAKVIGWKGEIPAKLSGFGVDLLFRNAATLQGVVEAIKETRKAKVVAPKATPAAKPAIVLPARQSVAPKPRVMVPATELVMPEGSDPFGRVSTASGLAFRCVCGCGGLVLESVAQVPPIGAMRDRQNGNRVGSKDLWRHAFGEMCIRRFGRGYSMRETMRQMMDEESKHEAASRSLRPSHPEPACFGSSGKGAPAWKLAKMAERAEKDRQIRNAMQSAGKKR